MSYDSDQQSIYCYKGSDVLVNKFDIRDQEKLDKVEADITQHNLMRLERKPVIGNFDLKHLQKIHTEIFKDIYEFSGKIRDERIYKGATEFCFPQYIKPYSDDVFKGLKKENYLKGLDVDKFCDRAAYYMGEINMLHPFREGNGRTQREFIRSMGLNAGYKLDWNKVDKDALYNASVKSVVNTKDLSDILKKCIENLSPNKEFAKIFELDREFER